jgi:hypothetical protein
MALILLTFLLAEDTAGGFLRSGVGTLRPRAMVLTRPAESDNHGNQRRSSFTHFATPSGLLSGRFRGHVLMFLLSHGPAFSLMCVNER